MGRPEDPGRRARPQRHSGPVVHFHGAAGTVTGSKHLVSWGDHRILLDCGLFQGLKALRLRNWDPPPFDPASLDAVVLSHAHLDHVGYLPRLVRQGFRGPVHCTRATATLVPIMLRDAAHLEVEAADRANRYGYTKHRPALPLFTLADAEEAITLLEPHDYAKPLGVADDALVRFRHAGHILGAATVELTIGATHPTIVAFSGDLGRWNRPILHDPETITAADLLILEATYGDRVHPGDAEEALASVVRDAGKRGSALLVPAFAVGRTQELLWTIREMEDSGRIPVLPVYLDSPMAQEVTDLYLRHPEEHDSHMEEHMREQRALRPEQLRLCRTPQESRALNDLNGPFIIVAGSGMATGGRILHHMRLRLSDPRTTVLFPGFQAAGTRGRALQEGASHVRIHGMDVPVRARIVTIDGLSAHADRDDLLRWVGSFERPPQHTVLVHAEAPAASAFAETLRERRGWSVSIAEDGQSVTA